MPLDLSAVATLVGLAADVLAILVVVQEVWVSSVQQNQGDERDEPSDGPDGRHFAREERRDEG